MTTAVEQAVQIAHDSASCEEMRAGSTALLQLAGEVAASRAPVEALVAPLKVLVVALLDDEHARRSATAMGAIVEAIRNGRPDQAAILLCTIVGAAAALEREGIVAELGAVPLEDLWAAGKADASLEGLRALLVRVASGQVEVSP